MSLHPNNKQDHEDLMRDMKEMCRCGWMCATCWALGLSLVATLLAGCAFLIEPKTEADIATYNNQIFQMVMQSLGLIGTIVGFVGLWIKSNRVEKKAEATAHVVAVKAEETANVVAAKAQETKDKIEEIAEQTKRGPARATDSAPQKVELTGPGVTEPLKVKESGARQ